MQALLPDQIRANARKIAFGRLLQPPEQQTGHGQIEHRIPEEFEPLVMVGRKTAVRQRLLQKMGI